MGDVLQGAAGDCNSPEATRAWFDSRVAHQILPDQVLRSRGFPVRRTGETHGMQLASYISTSRHGIFYIRWPIPSDLHPLGRRTDIKVSLQTRSSDEARRLSRLLVGAGQSVVSHARRCGMRYDEIRQHVQKHYRDLLSAFKSEISANGPIEGQRLDVMRTSNAVAADDPEGFLALG